MINVAGTLLSKLNIMESSCALREKIGLPPISPMDAVRRKYGKNGLIEAYKENLKIVLSYVVKLCSRLPHKKIAITSDHGELLGEEGIYEHPNGPNRQNLQQPFPKKEEDSSRSSMVKS